MSTEELQEAASPDVSTKEPPTGPGVTHKKRPRLDLQVDARERKRGKSIFGLLVGTLNKAKIEDKERNASEAAKKRQLIEQRLQSKLRKETDSVRRAEEAKKDKTTANRKEEELQLKDSIYKLRRTRLPLLSNFLLTSDNIPSDGSPSSTKTLSLAPRSHPPPLYYLPAILTPAQEDFLQQRKAEVKGATEKEWDTFREERSNGIKEIVELRQRVAEEEARRKSEKAAHKETSDDDDVDKEMSDEKPGADAKEHSREAEMEVDEGNHSKEKEESKDTKGDSAPMQADDDDALEY